MSNKSSWEPSSVISAAEVLSLNEQVLALADSPINVREDIFRIHELEMDWDIGVVVYESPCRISCRSTWSTTTP
jgi:hypothetical protein